MSEWIDLLQTWLAAHPQWLGLAIFLIAFGECLAIIGLLVPGTLALFAVCALAGAGPLGLGTTLALGYAGGLCGDLLSYALGRRFHQNIRRLPGLRSHPEWLVGAELHFARYGSASLLLGRFIGPLRPMLPMVAGMLDMPVPRFVLVSLLASAGWALAYLLPGWATGAALRLPLPADFWPEAGVVCAVLALLLGSLIWLCLRRWAAPPWLAAGLCALAFAALALGLPYLKALDLGLLQVIQEQRSPAHDRVLMAITRFGDFEVQLAVAALLCILLLALRQWRALAFAVIALLGTACGNRLLKESFARARPDVLLEPLHTYSFPSGHASASFALCLTFGILAGREQPPRLRLTWLLLAGLPALWIALSRVYLGVHWSTDVLGGALLAGGACALALGLLQRSAGGLPALPRRAWWLILPACLLLLGGYGAWGLPGVWMQYRY